MLLDAKVKLLIVDDDPSIRTSLSQIFTTLGLDVRSADDGFAALSAIENELPDVLLSDLNMPGMSGFNLLAVVRRRFSSIGVVAMSGAYSGANVPAGVIADAFYEKGSTLDNLLQTVMSMGRMESRSIGDHREPSPIWIPGDGNEMREAGLDLCKGEVRSEVRSVLAKAALISAVAE